MTNTPQFHLDAISAAGDDFTWNTPNAPAQIDSAHRQGLTAILTDRQQGLCLACGDTLAGAIDLCHIVPSRKGNAGVMGGNVYVGHGQCNLDDAFLFGNGIVPLASLARLDLLVTSLPTRAACVARAVEAKTRRVAIRAARLARLA